MMSDSHSFSARRDVSTTAVALRVISIGLGIFFLAMSMNKVAWIGDPSQLSQRFTRWLPNASPYASVYLRAVAIPAAPVFARVVPVAEFLAGVALLTGVMTNVAAAAALFMIANFHLATSSYSSLDFLRDGTGPPMFAALLALALVRVDLPFSLAGRSSRSTRLDVRQLR